ncbi:glycosyltransferase family 39 protein [bacterium]|nr:glycosyltransferase family 39 protein [bacterium]
MEKIKKIIQSETFIDISLIVLVMIILTISSGFLAYCFLADRGREFLFPQAILNGLVPYKDITMAYFPLSYYINAFVYKLFGVSFGSLIIFGACFSTFFMIIYYLTAKEFLNRKISILLSLFVLLSCVFCMHDLCMYVSPYSYARVYGLIGGVACLFFLLKLFNTDNIKYAYLAAFFTSFSISNKIEFAPVIVILIAGLILYKKVTLRQCINILLITMIFPALTVLLLVLGGVSLSDITEAVKFAISFSSTEAMHGYIVRTGITPVFQPDMIIKGFPPLLITLLLSLLYCFLDKKFNNNKIIFASMLLITTLGCYFMKNTQYYWVELPLFVVLLAIVFFKPIIKDKKMLLFLIAALILSQRAMFQILLSAHGVYAFPMMIMCAVVIFQNYLSKCFPKFHMEKFIIFFLLVLVGTYSLQQYTRTKYVRFPLETSKGTIYMTPEKAKIFGNTLKYIEENIPEDAKLLVVPEGPIFNYISGRKIDMHCFMMDKFYHDAYGAEKALEILKNADYDYIIVAENFDLFSGGGFEELFTPEGSLCAKYVYANYTKVYQEAEDKSPQNILTIYKKNE